MSQEKINWKRRAERAESRYQELHDEVESYRTARMGHIIELADTRHYAKQVRALLNEALEMIDSIEEAEAAANRIQAELRERAKNGH